MGKMTATAFLRITLKVVKRDGFSSFLPTLALPEPGHISVIHGIPDDVDHREAVQRIVRDRGLHSTEFFFAVRSRANELTVGHHRPGQTARFLITTFSGDQVNTREAQVDWWMLE